MSETTTIAHARACEHCGERRAFLFRHISKDGRPLFSVCLTCRGETPYVVLPPLCVECNAPKAEHHEGDDGTLWCTEDGLTKGYGHVYGSTR